MPPRDDEEATKRKLAAWLTFERAVTLGSLLIAVGCLLTTVRQLDSRVTKLEVLDERKNELLSDIRGDIKLLLERTDPNQRGIK